MQNAEIELEDSIEAAKTWLHAATARWRSLRRRRHNLVTSSTCTDPATSARVCESLVKRGEESSRNSQEDTDAGHVGNIILSPESLLGGWGDSWRQHGPLAELNSSFIVQAVSTALQDAANDASMHVEDLDTSFEYSAYTVSSKPLTLSPALCGTPSGMLTRMILIKDCLVQHKPAL